jgi:hypothetical protein
MTIPQDLAWCLERMSDVDLLKLFKPMSLQAIERVAKAAAEAHGRNAELLALYGATFGRNPRAKLTERLTRISHCGQPLSVHPEDPWNHRCGNCGLLVISDSQAIENNWEHVVTSIGGKVAPTNPTRP